MALNPLFYDNTVIHAVANAGASANSGFLAVYTGAQPALNGALTGTQLVAATFSATAFGTPAASGGTVTATANAITATEIANTGTAGYHAVLKSDGVTIVWTGSVGTSGADLNVSSTSFVTGATFSCSAYTLREPQG
jgi:uncharacterized Zn-binding protein involved in type VI secretion